MKIGFIGQGYVGKNYADDFEKRGFDVVRFAKGESYKENKEKLSECNIVFIAVPTPTTPDGFDTSILQEVLKIPIPGTTVVIKSTILPGTTESLQKNNPDIYILNSPEFLSEVTAAYDATHPDRNIIGIPIDSDEYRKRAGELLSILPKASYDLICTSKEAELIKYGRNTFGFINVVYTNLFYDLAKKLDLDWNIIQGALEADPMISSQYLNPIHKKGRGAGGSCFIKDFEAFLQLYEKSVEDKLGIKVLKSLRDKNVKLLLDSDKDKDLLESVYGALKNK